MSRLSIRVTESDIEQGTICLTLSGDLDLATRQDLIAAVQPLLARIPRRIVIDLAGVKVLDSAGIGALVSCWKLAQDAGCVLRLRNPRPLAYAQLRLTGLLDVFALPV